MNIPEKSHRNRGDSHVIPVDTSNILFIAAGAFSGIEKIISQRKDTKTIGFAVPLKLKHDASTPHPTPITTTNNNSNEKKLLINTTQTQKDNVMI